MSATGTPGDVRGATKRSTTDISAASAHPGGLPLRSGHWHVSVGWPSLIIILFILNVSLQLLPGPLSLPSARARARAHSLDFISILTLMHCPTEVVA